MRVLDAARSRPLEGGPTFTLGNRLLRCLWIAVWLLLARWTPPPLHRWRALLLRAFGARIGRGARVHGSARVWLPANLRLGAHALIGPGAEIYNQGRITIGERSVISQRAHLCASSHDLKDPDFQLQLRPIAIGNRCWIAAEAFVGPGVTMADGAMLAARGALFDDAEPHGVYRGNPAALIKVRQLRSG